MFSRIDASSYIVASKLKLRRCRKHNKPVRAKQVEQGTTNKKCTTILRDARISLSQNKPARMFSQINVSFDIVKNHYAETFRKFGSFSRRRVTYKKSKPIAIKSSCFCQEDTRGFTQTSCVRRGQGRHGG